MLFMGIFYSNKNESLFISIFILFKISIPHTSGHIFPGQLTAIK